MEQPIEVSQELIELIKSYARENMDMCSDGILHDPILRGGQFTAENVAMSDDCSTHSTIHASKYHAARDILILLGVDVSDM